MAADGHAGAERLPDSRAQAKVAPRRVSRLLDGHPWVPARTDADRNGGNVMSIVAWLILGVIAGFIASRIVNKAGEGLILDLVLGIIGAIVGGFLFSYFGAAGVTGLNLYSLVVAIIGAIVVLVIYHAIVGRTV
jgi:uncharacterized membrane protein YeaQ/YmgE (transglycosylase-associated protein family)